MEETPIYFSIPRKMKEKIKSIAKNLKPERKLTSFYQYIFELGMISFNEKQGIKEKK